MGPLGWRSWLGDSAPRELAPSMSWSSGCNTGSQCDGDEDAVVDWDHRRFEMRLMYRRLHGTPAGECTTLSSVGALESGRRSRRARRAR